MRNVCLLFAATCLALLVFLVAVGLHEYLYTFDPYSWAFPGTESDRSRSLWLYRRDLYRTVGLISFTLTIAFAAAALVAKRRNR